MEKTRILLVEDHEVVREGVRRLIGRERDMTIVGEVDNAEDALSCVTELKPDVILMDIGLPGMNGIEATERIKSILPTVRVLVMTIHDEEEYVMGIIAAGADGYLLKNTRRSQLVHSLRAVAQGQLTIDESVHPMLIRLATSRNVGSAPIRINAAEQLTSRETEVLTLAAKGMTNKEIAAKLKITPRTVKGHMMNVFTKLRVNSRTEAVLLALRSGWVSM
ncbi:MAG: response regulator transcription factor [Dehalococcoidia bacterium]|nr:response regulator transcription factor [Dehalococcoidia bacterium]